MKNGGYFPFPNDVIDKLLPKLTGAEFKVFSVVLRQTLGWKKRWDQIANSQFRKKGGLSKSGVMVSLDVLLDNNLILCEKVIETGKLPENWYALFGETNEKDRLVRSPDQYDKKTGTLIILELVRSIDQLGDKLVRSPDPQKKGLKDIEKHPPTPKIDETTSNGETEEAAAANSESSDEDLRMSQKAKKIQDLIFAKWKNQIKKKPDFGSCKEALREFDWDHKILVHAITLAPRDLTSRRPESALRLVIRIAERVCDEGSVEHEPETREQELIKALKYRAQFPFPHRADEIYEILELLAEETGRPLPELYAENDYLTGTLKSYKEEAAND